MILIIFISALLFYMVFKFIKNAYIFSKNIIVASLAETLADSGVNDGLIVAKRNGVPGPDHN